MTTPVQRRAALSDGPMERYVRMLEIRFVEDRVKELFAQGLVPGTAHTAQGQEGVAVALAAATTLEDTFTCTYRGHAIALALGMEPCRVLGEIMGRSTGAIGGVGGSMHLADPAIGLMPTFAIVGAGLPVAVGAAIAARYNKTRGIAVAVCGDGATNIGAFHEALNLASVWNAPVLFVIENNLYGEYSPLRSTTPIDDLYLRGVAYAMESEAVDGQDAEALLPFLRDQVEAVRDTCRPRLVELKTYRFAGHSRSDPAAYRPAGELERWLQRDPLRLARDRLAASGTPAEELDAAKARVRAEIDSVTAQVQAAPSPAAAAMFRNIRAGDRKGA